MDNFIVFVFILSPEKGLLWHIAKYEILDGYVWFPESLRENAWKKKIEWKRKRKRKEKVKDHK